MSVEYDVIINNSIYNGFETFLEEWLKQSGFENSSINKTDDSKKYFVFSKSSIRGLVITKVEKFLKKDLHIRLSSLSSKSDWLMLYSLIDYINIKNKTKVLEEGKILKRSTINKEYFLRMAEDDQKGGFNLVKTLFEKENYVKFPLWDVDLVIWKDCFDKLNDSNSLARYLEEKAFRVYFARRAGVITLEGNVQLSVWDFNDVIFGKVNYITISEDVSKEELFFVPWKEFLTSNFVKYDTIPRNKNELPYYFIYGIDRSMVGEAFEYYKTLSISMEDIKRMNNE